MEMNFVVRKSQVRELSVKDRMTAHGCSILQDHAGLGKESPELYLKLEVSNKIIN